MKNNIETINDFAIDLIQSLKYLSKKRQEDLALASIDLVN